LTSLFDRQYNCLTQPEKDLTWAFLTVALDPFTPGVVQAVYDAAWVSVGGVGGQRESVYREAFGLINVYIEPVDFVVSTAGSWFLAYADSIGSGDSNPIGLCPCDSF